MEGGQGPLPRSAFPLLMPRLPSETGTTMGPALPQENMFLDHMGPWNWPSTFQSPSTLEAVHSSQSLVSCVWGIMGQEAGHQVGGCWQEPRGASETDKKV